MKITFFDSHEFEKDSFLLANKKFNFKIEFQEAKLNVTTARLAIGSSVVCSFINDNIDEKCMEKLNAIDIRLIALRSAGFNHVDLLSAKKYGIKIARIPSYSPNAIAEFAVGMLLSLSRKIPRAFNRVRELNFSLDGLVGFNLNGKTIGVIGAGKIGKIFATIMASFGCTVFIYDMTRDPELVNHPSIRYTSLTDVYRESDVISLHLPLTPVTNHIIDSESIAQMKYGVMIINTGRGALIDSKSLIEGLKTGRVRGAALDVYEEEENCFFHDLSNKVLDDDVLARLLTFPNVLITSHQAFLTQEALEVIANTTLENIFEFSQNGVVPEQRRVNADNFILGENNE
jgi:D-lactate dehydrogenase